MVGPGRRTTEKPGQSDASLLVLELFLRELGHRTFIRTLALSYFLLRGILCPKGTSSVSFCSKRAWYPGGSSPASGWGRTCR